MAPDKTDVLHILFRGEVNILTRRKATAERTSTPVLTRSRSHVPRGINKIEIRPAVCNAAQRKLRKRQRNSRKDGESQLPSNGSC
jgi:hypothetical protein